MYRLEKDDLELKIHMAAWRVFNKFGKLVHHKVRGAVQAEIVGELQREFVNDHTCVVVTGTSGFSMDAARLKFGVDEPWPAPTQMENHGQR